MKRLLYIAMTAMAVAVTTACKNVDEEPHINQGYATSYRVPDAEPMTAEDSAIVAAQQLEYDTNAT